MTNPINNAFFRFLIAGGINTLLTYGIFILLSRYFHHTIAYTIAYLVGIAFSYAMAAAYVFRSGITVRTVLRYPFVYAVQYLYGLITLSLLVDLFGVSQPLAMLVVIATTIPLTFVLTQHAMRSAPSLQKFSDHRTPVDLERKPTSNSRARP
jgi:putative flippase GtrA